MTSKSNTQYPIKNLLLTVILLIVLPFITFTSLHLGNSLYSKIFYFVIQVFLIYLLLTKFITYIDEICLKSFDNGKTISVSENVFVKIKSIICIASYFAAMYLLLNGLARTYIIYFSIFIFLMTIRISPKKMIVGNTYIYMRELIESEEETSPLKTKFPISLKENTLLLKKSELKGFEFIGDTLFITLSNGSCVAIDFENIDKDTFFEMLQ